MLGFHMDETYMVCCLFLNHKHLSETDKIIDQSAT